ncbi:MOSC domain-containing protein [Sagittula stellata]|uniref:MOSC domain protein n=1 Tax=Sagittula stellata (strain ATCC 700073 / DSM 11524 / E-37) TaxID=388399 RepID=A3K232_SAGS3|nr:MOSC domain-containing protein [Sagittula stellata]EBA08978.1 MOSC domain protein [Sagittula stellata E-37]
MIPLAELRRSFAGPGRIDWIGLRPARLAPSLSVSRCTVSENGLDGDHGRGGKRAVTLIQAEHIPVIAALCGQEVTAAMLRRNLVVSGLNLTAAREFGLKIGEVVLEITAPCAPCSRMETVLGQGGYTAMRGHGGWCAKVLVSGEIEVGHRVIHSS